MTHSVVSNPHRLNIHTQDQSLTSSVRETVGVWLCSLRINLMNEIIFPHSKKKTKKKKKPHKTKTLISDPRLCSLQLISHRHIQALTQALGQYQVYIRNFYTEQGHVSVML